MEVGWGGVRWGGGGGQSREDKPWRQAEEPGDHPVDGRKPMKGHGVGKDAGKQV